MNRHNIFRTVILLSILTVGVWLLGRPGSLQPEGPTRLQALNSLSLNDAASGVAAQDDVSTGQSVVLEPVSPVEVNFSEVRISTEDPDSMYNRWLRGELDLDESESLVSEAEMARMVQEALAQEVDDDVQQARSIVPGAGDPQPAAPAPGVSFDAIDYTDSGGSVPPDPELAVGPNHMIAVVNVAVAIYDKTGTALFGPTIASNLFSDPGCQSGLYDPNVLYDEEANRWILAYDKGAFETDGGYCLLASQSGDPTGIWYEYFFQVNTGTVWLDFPHAGVGDSYIVMGGNMFTYGGAYSEGRLFGFDKSDLYAGDPVSAVQRGLGGSGGTPQPLNLHGQSSGTWPSYGNNHYIITDPYNGQTYTLHQWNVATNVLTTVGSPIDLGPANQPVDVPQDGTGLVQANDWRLLDFEFRNGYGWTTQTVSCNPGGGAVNCIRWAQIDLSNANIGPAGTGTYGSNGQYRFFPDLAVNDCNDMAVGYTRSSSSSFPSIWVTGRENTDPNGTLQAEAQLKAGEIAYTAFDSSPRRWGDYTGMTIDPDGETFWYLGEYSKNTGNINGRWGTYIGSFGFGGCGSPPPDLPYDSFLPLIAKPVPPPPPPPSGPDPGYWLGGNAQAPDFMEFWVTPDRASVEQFTIYINVDGCGGYQIWRNVPSTIANNSFSFTGSYYASGTFSTSTNASGSVGLDSFYISGCGYVSGGPVNWQADWTDNSQPSSIVSTTSPFSVSASDTRSGIELYTVER